MTTKILDQAARIINSGGLVSFPTETVYGLGANALNQEACLKIYEAKARPNNNPLIVHVAKLEQAENLAIFSNDAYLLSKLWPGPLTMVLPKKNNSNNSLVLAPSVTAGLNTVAIRVPAHKIANELIIQSEVPIAAPSANRSGYLSPTSHEHVRNNFKNSEIFVIDSNSPSLYGIESTIIDLSTSTPTILRFGFITPQIIENILGKKVAIATKISSVKAPGMMYSHYAPTTPIRINVEFLAPDEVGLNFGSSKLNSEFSMNLSPEGDLIEAAANLFSYLHILDNYARKNSIKRIAVAPIPENSVGLAVNDRLSKAANTKPGIK